MRSHRRNWAGMVGLLLAACGPGGGGGGTVVRGAVVTGHIEAFGTTGSGVGGVTVRLAGRTATTNEQGWYVFSDVTASDRAVVTAEKDGFLRAVEAFQVQDGVAYHIDMVLLRAAGTEQVTASTGGMVSAGGVQIMVPANAFATASGGAVSGSVTLSIGVLDPSGQNGGEAFPGDFIGRRTDGTEEPLESFGLFAIEARQGTELLSLAQGRSLMVVAPVAPSTVARAPMSVPLWSLDESTGIWREEGVATRSGNNYTATIPHLSWWNFDGPYLSSTTCVKVCFTNNMGAAVRGVRAHIRMNDIASSAEGYSGGDGCVELNVKANSPATLSTFYNGRPGPTREFTTSSTITNTRQRPSNCQDLGTLNLDPMQAQLILSWGERPSDLDSHMTGPSDSGRFHTYFSSRGSSSAAPFCELDTDDTSSFGPEVVTIQRATNGVYRYSIHNYSGQSSHPIQSSGATVTILVPSLAYVRRFDVPTSNPSNGNIWRVVDLVAEGNRITAVNPINDFANGSSDGAVYNP